MQYSNNPFEPLFQFFRTHRQMLRGIILFTLCIVLLICWRMGSGNAPVSNIKYSHVDLPISEEEFEESFSFLQTTELDRIMDPENARELVFNDTTETVEITEGGSYLLSGRLNGTVHIRAKEQNVHLFLNGVEINSKSGPAIYCEDADKLVITLMENSENTLSDSSNYRDDPEAESCVSAVCDITFNGTGTLALNGYYKDGIHSRDMVKILGGTFKIKCKRTGIHGNDGILIRDGKFTISSEKYGMKTTKSGADGRGSLMIAGGEMNLIAGRYAFVTTKANLYIYSCQIISRSVVDTYQVGGFSNVQWGCVDER